MSVISIPHCYSYRQLGSKVQKIWSFFGECLQIDNKKYLIFAYKKKKITKILDSSSNLLTNQQHKMADFCLRTKKNKNS